MSRSIVIRTAKNQGNQKYQYRGSHSLPMSFSSIIAEISSRYQQISFVHYVLRCCSLGPLQTNPKFQTDLFLSGKLRKIQNWFAKNRDHKPSLLLAEAHWASWTPVINSQYRRTADRPLLTGLPDLNDSQQLSSSCGMANNQTHLYLIHYYKKQKGQSVSTYSVDDGQNHFLL